MKTELIKLNDKYALVIPDEYIKKLNLQESDCVDINLNQELTNIIIGPLNTQNIEDIEASEDF